MRGRIPFGYKRQKDQLVIDRAKFPIVRHFFDHFLLYGCIRSAVRAIKHKYGKTIAVSTGKQWLTNPVYRGDWPQGNKIWRDHHPPILSREEGAQIDRLLRRNRSFSPRSASSPRSLSGLVRCSVCHHPFTIVSVQNYVYLRCPNCPAEPKCRGLSYQASLESVLQQICQQLPPFLAAIPQTHLSNLRANLESQINAKLELLNRIPDYLNQGIFDGESAQIRMMNLHTEIARLQQELSQLPPMDLNLVAPTLCRLEFWQDLSEVERRRYFREFIHSIDFTPPDRLIVNFIPRSAPAPVGIDSGQSLPATQ